jgi:hypothetical protein
VRDANGSWDVIRVVFAYELNGSLRWLILGWGRRCRGVGLLLLDDHVRIHLVDFYGVCEVSLVVYYHFVFVVRRIAGQVLLVGRVSLHLNLRMFQLNVWRVRLFVNLLAWLGVLA